MEDLYRKFDTTHGKNQIIVFSPHINMSANQAIPFANQVDLFANENKL